MQMKKLLFVLSVTFLVGCRVDASSEDEMYQLASALTKLSAAVESTVRYKNPPDGMSDEELLTLATQHDPDLLQPFSGYAIKVRRDNHHAILLICTKQGDRALLEDVGCSAKLDAHPWQSQLAKACTFTLTADKACAAP